MRSVFPIAIALLAGSLAACGSCTEKKNDANADAATTAAVSSTTPANAVAETLPRCRADGARVAIEGEDVIVGDAALSPGGLLVGIARRTGRARMGSILRTSAGLTDAKIIDVAPIHGDGPPPSPRWRDGKPWVLFHVRKEIEAGTTRGMRELRIAPLEDQAIGPLAATITQQADESTAFDVAWPLVAWDEDALVQPGKFIPERGVVKVQAIPDGRPHVVSPDASDTEAPKLAPKRGGGFWLAWLARRAEVEDAGWRLEGAGDLRAWRWVEIVALDANGEVASPVRRVTPEKGHAVSFDIVSTDPEVAIIVQDEAAPAEGAGARIVRYVVESDRIGGSDLVDAGVGHALAEVVDGWVAWKDTADRAFLAPANPGGAIAGTPTSEAALDGARVLAGTAGLLYVTSGAEVRRFECAAPKP